MNHLDGNAQSLDKLERILLLTTCVLFALLMIESYHCFIVLSNEIMHHFLSSLRHVKQSSD